MKIWFGHGYNFYQDDIDTKFLVGIAYRTWSNDHKRFSYKGLTVELILFTRVISFHYVNNKEVYEHYMKERAEKHAAWKAKIKAWSIKNEGKS